MKSDLHLRHATMGDAKILLDWRNDPLTRAQSRNTDLVSLADHMAWLQKRLGTHTLYIAEYAGEPVGSLRSDSVADGKMELSWTVAPGMRGKGYGKRMVLQFVAEIHPGKKFLASIKKGNVASEKIAVALGLHEVGHEDAGEKHSFMVWC